jgi:DNA repair protein RecN (Recombination protein N)
LIDKKLLKSLYIKNFALIDELFVEFASGLNILTGETGAGKSILIDAFMMALGERASTQSIRTGEKKSIIEAIFNIGSNDYISDFLVRNEIEKSEDLILRREINLNGNTRCFVNDSPYSLSLLKELGDLLVDFHGQHEHQLLLNSNYHLEIIDSLIDFQDPLVNYMENYKELKNKIQCLQELIVSAKESTIRFDNYQYELGEINKIEPQENEIDELEEKLKIIENSEQIFALCNDLYNSIYDNTNSARDLMIAARKNLEQLSKIDKEFEPYLNDCKSAVISIEEIAKYACDYGNSYTYDLSEIDALRNRLSSLNRLRRKYGAYQDVFLRKIFLENEISKITNFEYLISENRAEIEQLRINLGKHAVIITQKRKTKAEEFSKKLIEKLKYLGMENAKFEVRFSNFETQNELSTIISNQAYTAYNNGIDKLEFYIATNLGEDFKPLKETASGGEISRIMLSLKSIVAESNQMPMLVFDEIDTGISGKIGQKTGYVMKELSKSHQILAITHLPQIAALGDRNFYVSKIETDLRTITKIEELDENEKIISIAQMLSGENISESALQSAKELIV